MLQYLSSKLWNAVRFNITTTIILFFCHGKNSNIDTVQSGCDVLLLITIITRRQKVSWSILSFCSKALSSCVHALLNEQSLSLSLLPLTMKLRRVNKRLPRQPLLAGAFIAQSRRWVILKGEVIMCISECVNVGIAFVLSPFHYSTRHISPDSSRTSSITSTSSLFGS